MLIEYPSTNNQAIFEFFLIGKAIFEIRLMAKRMMLPSKKIDWTMFDQHNFVMVDILDVIYKMNGFLEYRDK